MSYADFELASIVDGPVCVSLCVPFTVLMLHILFPFPPLQLDYAMMGRALDEYDDTLSVSDTWTCIHKGVCTLSRCLCHLIVSCRHPSVL